MAELLWLQCAKVLNIFGIELQEWSQLLKLQENQLCDKIVSFENCLNHCATTPVICVCLKLEDRHNSTFHFCTRMRVLGFTGYTFIE
jgi:hypothetical protein